MLAVDRKVPWGRGSEDVIARRRQRKAHQMHRQRLKDTQRQVDSNEPHTTTMTHLRVRAKKRQMADDRLQTIANENRKLMEKMSAIMRNKGPAVGANAGGKAKRKSPTRLRPLQRGEAIYDKGGLHTAVRRREQNRIVSENRAILQRIKSGKNTRSFYDHNVMARQEKERSRHIKNISKSYQREVRVKKAAARRRIMQSSMPTVFAPSGASMDSSGYGQIMDSSMKISLHTAKQIREDVATQRGLPLPDLMSRRPGDKGPAIGGMGGGSVVGVRRSVNQEESMQSKFTISHTGAPGGKGGEEGGGGLTGFGFENSFANMSLDGGGPGSEEGFADYDYGSAEGGEFKGRGYSAASGNRPGTTAQSARSQISKE